MSTLSFPFARKVDEALRKMDQIPLYGKAPHLDLDRLSSLLREQFKAPVFSLSLTDASWRPPSELQKDLGIDPISLSLSLSPLKGEVVWLMSKKDVAQLSSSLLGKPKKDLQSELLQEGFYLYSVLRVLDTLQEEPPFRDFSLRLSDEVPLSPKEQAYCIDLKISLEHRSCFGRLVLSSSFLTSWRSHFASLRESFSLSPLAKTLEVSLGIRIGSVLITQEEWNRLEKGDVLLLDRGSYDPRHKEGIASLSLGATPLFHVSVKENRIKLIQPALFYEEDMDQRDTTSELPNTSQQNEGRSLAIKEVPLFITVELSRLRMTIDQLMNLVPGNFLELPIHPEQGVILSVNGQKIARAELVHLGEALGVRILEI